MSLSTSKSDKDKNIEKVVLKPNLKKGPLSPESIDISIDMSKFGNEVLNCRQDNDARKYNIKIKKSDLYLIEEIANLEGTSRAEIINSLIKNYLEKALTEIKEDNDYETTNLKLKLLIASRADALSDKTSEAKFKYDPSGWCGYVAKERTEDVIEEIKHAAKYGTYDVNSIPSELNNLTEEEYLNQTQTDVYKAIKKLLLEI